MAKSTIHSEVYYVIHNQGSTGYCWNNKVYYQPGHVRAARVYLLPQHRDHYVVRTYHGVTGNLIGIDALVDF